MPLKSIWFSKEVDAKIQVFMADNNHKYNRAVNILVKNAFKYQREAEDAHRLLRVIDAYKKELYKYQVNDDPLVEDYK